MSPLPPDPYKILGVSKDARIPEIRSAHRKLVLKCHPDKVQDPKLKAAKQDEFQKVQQAYELLSDDRERQRYDDQARLADLREQLRNKANISTPRAAPKEYNVYTADPRPSPGARPPQQPQSSASKSHAAYAGCTPLPSPLSPPTATNQVSCLAFLFMSYLSSRKKKWNTRTSLNISILPLQRVRSQARSSIHLPTWRSLPTWVENARAKNRLIESYIRRKQADGIDPVHWTGIPLRNI